MKKTYIAPEIEKIAAMMQERVMDTKSGINNSGQNEWGGGANEGQFDDDEDDNGFTPVATSLWD